MAQRPSYTAMEILRDLDLAAQELEFFHKVDGEFTALRRGDRVALLTPEGELLGTVQVDWSPSGYPSTPVEVSLDCNPHSPLSCHRSLFRALTILDFLADIRCPAH